jgi:thioredoxin reductase
MTLTTLDAPTVRAHLTALPVAIIGAGPIGLAAAAHLLERGIEVVIYESGAKAAHSVSTWGHVRLFSPWRHLIDPAARRLLETAGWSEPRNLDVAPTGAELVEHYLAPLAALAPIATRLHAGVTVDAVTRKGMDRTRSSNRDHVPFVLRVTDTDGVVTEHEARAVIDASGTYTSTNSISSNGLDPLGYAAVRDAVSGPLPDVLGTEREHYAGASVAVIGAGHSAAATLIDLATLQQTAPDTRITWVIRNATPVRVFTADSDELSDRAAIGVRLRALIADGRIEVVNNFETVRVELHDGQARIVGARNGGMEHLDVDRIVPATGFRPDLGMLREVRLNLDEVVEAPRALAPLIDPNVHSCGTVEPHGFAELQQPEQNFFIAGMKSYGRAPTFLLATGYEQVRSIAAYLAGDLASASAVELVLPATGVCSTDSSAASCCS